MPTRTTISGEKLGGGGMGVVYRARDTQPGIYSIPAEGGEEAKALDNDALDCWTSRLTPRNTPPR